ncbi:MAG: DUF4369 domain-containing protein, partial [Sphingobacteriales bacterium]|nr:DUF4369 domain-containing protein [Sphingobacteriales bacterium]
MKQIVFFMFLLPVLAFGQVKKIAKSKTKTVSTATPIETIGADEYIIYGDVTGFPDGSTVAILNGQSGAPEVEATVTKNKFTLKGKITAPDFKILSFNKQQPYITLFLDNSIVHFKGNQSTIAQATVTGSPSNKDFQEYS